MTQQPDQHGQVVPLSASDRQAAFAAEFRTPRAAGVAGVIFAVSLGALVVLLNLALPHGGDLSEWITDESRRRQVVFALELVPFAGLAFLWFIGVIRARLGSREDQLFATVFLGSGLLFVGMLFTAAAGLGGLLTLYDGSSTVSEDDVRLVSATSIVLLATFGIRMAAVFTFVVTNLGRRTGIVPRWLQLVGYVAALALFLAPPRTVWVTMLFPIWVLLLSIEILIASARDTDAPTVGESSQPDPVS